MKEMMQRVGTITHNAPRREEAASGLIGDRARPLCMELLFQRAVILNDVFFTISHREPRQQWLRRFSLKVQPFRNAVIRCSA